MRKSRCLWSLPNIISQFLTPQVWKRAHQAWQGHHTPSRWRLQAIVWVLLGMAWCLGDSVEERFVLARASYVAHHLKVRRPGETLAGFLHALADLPMPVLRALNCCMCEQFSELFVDAVRVGGWAPFACDGTRLLCPRSEELQRHLGAAAQEGSPPMLFLTALVLLPLGIPWTWRWGKGNADERRHLQSMLASLPAKSLLVLDACYPSYDLYERLKKAGLSFLVRVSNRSIFYPLDGDRRTQPHQFKRMRDRLVQYWPNEAAREKNKPPIVVRLLRIRGKKCDVWLATNIMDNDQLSRKTAAQVYRWRWRNEGLFRQYKHMMHKVKLASRSVALLHREGEGAMLALQMLLAHAAQMTHKGKKVVIVMDSPRRMLLIIRSAMTTALHRLGPGQLAMYQFLIAKVRAEERQRASSRTRQIWPRRRDHKPPKPPQLRVMSDELKAKRQRIFAAA
jgi:hypothetical protein